ncbi:S-methyl-5'-thioadenosine phosphorylase [Candidatus Woesearchaeota archaeon]|nr:S-methyl-5'-thioadenosine phosphorylase [Candidatus Woesearchaeota archaeon]
MVVIGIIGGSGVGAPDILENPVKQKVHTPYSSPSEFPTVGTFRGVKCVLIPRHGEGHRFSPTNVNYRANIWAMKELGVTHILAPTACGSLREEVKPGHLVFIDQFIDRTTKRQQSFYDGHQICHISMAEPLCKALRSVLVDAAKRLGLEHHAKGTMVTIEGPRFSTKAESHIFRQWGADVINMTTVPEVVLAREAGMCYAAIAMSTDYDCWRESTEAVTLEMVMSTMKKNADNVLKLVKDVIPRVTDSCHECRDAIKTALM